MKRFGRHHVSVALIAGLVLAALALGMLPSAAAEQARRLRRIETNEDATLVPLDEAPPLPELAACERAIRTIAAAYNSNELGEYLDEQFPNRFELLDALMRAEVRVTNLEMLVESVENVRFLPWQVITEDDDGQTIAADCVADVRLRAAFDAVDTGERTVTEVSRGEWRVRFTRTHPAQEVGR